MRRPLSAYARLMAEPRRFGFDAALRVLTRAARCPDPAEAARFRSPPGLAFPPSDIASVAPPESGQPTQVVVSLMGLTGPSGVLPRHYTEALSRALADFLDVLAHRLIASFGRAGAKYRVHRAADLASLGAASGGEVGADRMADQAGQALLALTGYGTPHLLPRLAVGAAPLQHYAGLFAMRPRSADRLAALASDWLGRAVEVEQFAGTWLFLPPEQRTALPLGRGAGAWNRLGIDAAIGVRAWDVQARVVLRVGPLDCRTFEALLPDRPGSGRFVSLVRAYLGFETGFAVNLVLAAEEVPPLRLDPGATSPPRLGWNTWALPAARPIGGWRDRGDAVFEAEMVEAEQARADARPGGGP